MLSVSPYLENRAFKFSIPQPAGKFFTKRLHFFFEFLNLCCSLWMIPYLVIDVWAGCTYNFRPSISFSLSSYTALSAEIKPASLFLGSK
jgi:hypothetical protein